EHFLTGAPLLDNETSVAVVNDYPKAIEGILQVLPGTRQVFMIMGSGQLGQFWHRELEPAFKRFGNRVTFIWSDKLPWVEILRQCAELPRDAAIVYLSFGTDAAGAAYADDRVFADLGAAATAAIFAVQSVYMGHGIVGGALMS